MSEGQRRRYRQVVTPVDTVLVEALFLGVPKDGVIRRVIATADPNVDPEASTGLTGATDIQAEVRERTGATGVGGPSGALGSQGVILVYGLTPLTPDLTIDSEEDIDYHCPWVGTPTLAVAVALDSGHLTTPGTVVVVLEIEEYPVQR